jgi:hypothetical protein
MSTATIQRDDVCRAAPIGKHRLSLWRAQKIIKLPYSVEKTLALAVGCTLSDEYSLAIEIIKIPVAFIASKTEQELLGHFERGESRLTIDLDHKQCTIESPTALARRFASDPNTRLLSIPIRAAWERVVKELSQQ